LDFTAELAFADSFEGINAEVLAEFGQIHPGFSCEINRNNYNTHHQIVQKDVDNNRIAFG
jgi:hypothetical protein